MKNLLLIMSLLISTFASEDLNTLYSKGELEKAWSTTLEQLETKNPNLPDIFIPAILLEDNMMSWHGSHLKALLELSRKKQDEESKQIVDLLHGIILTRRDYYNGDFTEDGLNYLNQLIKKRKESQIGNLALFFKARAVKDTNPEQAARLLNEFVKASIKTAQPNTAWLVGSLFLANLESDLEKYDQSATRYQRIAKFSKNLKVPGGQSAVPYALHGLAASLAKKGRYREAYNCLNLIALRYKDYVSLSTVKMEKKYLKMKAKK